MNKKEKKHELAEKAMDGFRNAVAEIVNLFCEKHNFGRYDDRDVYSVDEFCGTFMVGDYAFSLQTMMEDLADDLPEEELLRWYDYTCDYCLAFGTSEGCPNFRSWCQGCPRIDLGPIMKKKEELEKMIREAKQKF